METHTQKIYYKRLSITDVTNELSTRNLSMPLHHHHHHHHRRRRRRRR